MTKEDSQKNQDLEKSQQILKENEELKVILSILQDREKLKDEGYYRQQYLSLKEREVIAQERQAEALEASLNSSEEQEKGPEESVKP